MQSQVIELAGQLIQSECLQDRSTDLSLYLFLNTLRKPRRFNRDSGTMELLRKQGGGGALPSDSKCVCLGGGG